MMFSTEEIKYLKAALDNKEVSCVKSDRKSGTLIFVLWVSLVQRGLRFAFRLVLNSGESISGRDLDWTGFYIQACVKLVVKASVGGIWTGLGFAFRLVLN